MSDESIPDTTVTVSTMPSIGALHRRAALGMLTSRLGGRGGSSGSGGRGGSGGPGAPGRTLAIRGVTADREKLADYDRVCGFRLTDTLPATYPHIMVFPLAMKLMTDPGFPIPLVGIVHVANRITVHRPIDAGQPLDFTVYATEPRPHARGRQLDVVATATIDGEVCWTGVSTYLSRQRGPATGGSRAPSSRPAPPPASARWRFAPRVGTDYARVSGDSNPIHTSKLLARLLGFPQPIAHGMYSKARCLAALEGRLPDAYTVDVSFKLPVRLPSTLAFSAHPAGEGAGGWDFGLHSAHSGKPHLAGTIRQP